MKRALFIAAGLFAAAGAAIVAAPFDVAQGGGSRAASSAPVDSARGGQAPIFEVDPFWPKPLPNHWVMASTIVM
jgi:hypothetical protein